MEVICSTPARRKGAWSVPSPSQLSAGPGQDASSAHTSNLWHMDHPGSNAMGDTCPGSPMHLLLLSLWASSSHPPPCPLSLLRILPHIHCPDSPPPSTPLSAARYPGAGPGRMFPLPLLTERRTRVAHPRVLFPAGWPAPHKDLLCNISVLVLSESSELPPQKER